MPPKVFFLSEMVQQDQSVQNKYKEEDEIHFRNCYLNVFGRFNPVTQLNRVPSWMCGPSLMKVGQGILELLNVNGFGTFDPGDLDL